MTDADETRGQEPAGRAAQTIGPYRLLEPIGEGGMGEVWLAEQAKPVRRKVALKIIKAGMDTAQVVARFEAERQALALMDHPAIARVFEAGASASISSSRSATASSTRTRRASSTATSSPRTSW